MFSQFTFFSYFFFNDDKKDFWKFQFESIPNWFKRWNKLTKCPWKEVFIQPLLGHYLIFSSMFDTIFNIFKCATQALEHKKSSHKTEKCKVVLDFAILPQKSEKIIGH